MNKLKAIFKASIHFIIYCVLYAYIKIAKIKRNYWIISERGNDAGDNGYFFFKYMREKHKNIDVRYIITEESRDYDKVRKIGKTIKYGSLEHYIANLTSPVLISTHIYGYAVNQMAFKLFIIVFGNRGKMVSLKHGITKDYIKALNKQNTNLDLIIAGAQKEYEYMLKTYGYSKNELVFTGFPRFDELSSESDKIILIMPTWRHNLRDCDDIKNTDFYKRYQSLITNEDFLKYVKESGYRIVLYLHYEFQKYSEQFKADAPVYIYNKNDNKVQEYLKKSTLLVTDYSSVFFDFAYMGKPVVYYQFDYDSYRKNNYKEGYFSYKKHGFGPVLTEEDDLIEYCKQILKNRGEIEQKYLKKAKRFFGRMDKNNNSRVYDSIHEIIRSK